MDRLTTPAAEQIFFKAKERVYKLLTRSQFSQILATSNNTIIESNPCVLEDLVLYPIAEVPPKWKILKDILNELKLNSSKLPLNRSSNRHRVLILVRDELTSSQLQDILTYNESVVMDQRYRWFISQQSAEIRQKSKFSHKNKRDMVSTGKPRTSQGSLMFDEAQIKAIQACHTSSLGKESYSLDEGQDMPGDFPNLSKKEWESLSIESRLLIMEVFILSSFIFSMCFQS